MDEARGWHSTRGYGAPRSPGDGSCLIRPLTASRHILDRSRSRITQPAASPPASPRNQHIPEASLLRNSSVSGDCALVALKGGGSHAEHVSVPDWPSSLDAAAGDGAGPKGRLRLQPVREFQKRE